MDDPKTRRLSLCLVLIALAGATAAGAHAAEGLR